MPEIRSVTLKTLHFNILSFYVSYKAVANKGLNGTRASRG